MVSAVSVVMGIWRHSCLDSSSPHHVEACCDWLRQKVTQLNDEQYHIMQQHMEQVCVCVCACARAAQLTAKALHTPPPQAANCIVANVAYERLADHGPKLGAISRKNPLVTR